VDDAEGAEQQDEQVLRVDGQRQEHTVKKLESQLSEKVETGTHFKKRWELQLSETYEMGIH
jgi:hypothetical protein